MQGGVKKNFDFVDLFYPPFTAEGQIGYNVRHAREGE
jgi:hypothetical protein